MLPWLFQWGIIWPTEGCHFTPKGFPFLEHTNVRVFRVQPAKIAVLYRIASMSCHDVYNENESKRCVRDEIELKFFSFSKLMNVSMLRLWIRNLYFLWHAPSVSSSEFIKIVTMISSSAKRRWLYMPNHLWKWNKKVSVARTIMFKFGISGKEKVTKQNFP